MSFKKLLTISLFLVLAILSCSKEKDMEDPPETPDPPIVVPEPEPEPEPETNLVNVLDYYSFSSRILKLIAENNTDLPLDFTFHNVAAHKVIYNTIDHNEENTVASGILLLPDKEGDLPLLSFQHGTLLDPELAPSKSKFGNNELTLAAVLASSGIITIVPDYLGYGNSTLPKHPYEHKETLSRASYDMIIATNHYIKENNISTNDSLFIAGYSEGGFATIALQQLIEKENEFQLIQSYAGAGAYNKTTFTKMILEAQEEQAHMGYYLWVLYSYNYLYEGLNRSWSEYINEPYASKLKDIGQFNAPVADSLISKNVAELFHPKFISGIINETDTVFLEALEDNNVYDWKPENPIGLFHSKNDVLVDIINSRSMLEAIENRGGRNFTAIN
ncbi:MAG: lipase family protein [Flavobacteriaceae bacterium]